MIVSLRKLTKEAIYHYGYALRTDWVLDNISMVVIVATQVWWTWRVEDVFAKVKAGDALAMKKELVKQSNDLNDLVRLIRTPGLPKVNRSKVNTLIIMDVHARDIVGRFVRDSILDKKEFEWESQLRFYFDKLKDDLSIKQCTGVFDYTYEY